MYNPFYSFSDDVFRRFIAGGTRYYVLQRFEWTSIAPGNGFMVTPYEDLTEAEHHASALEIKEGKLLVIPEDIEKVNKLLVAGSPYRLFLNKLKEENWNSKMLDTYKQRITSYLRSRTSFTNKDSISILFTMEHGRVIANISNGDKELRVSAFELIK